MSILDRIKRGQGSLPDRLVLAGPEGIGKSTFASKAPSPLFICSEDGLTGLEFVRRFVPDNLDDLHCLLDGLIVSPGEFRTVVVDTADWLERFIGVSCCKRDSKTDIEDYGYGKGYVIIEGELIKILEKFDVLRTKGVGVIILSHVQIKNFVDPRGESYDRYEMKGHKRITGILREWPDACLFAIREVFKTKTKDKRRDMAIGGERVMHTEWSPAWDAKNRLSLPATLPLDWDALQDAIKANSPAALRKQVIALAATATLPDENARMKLDKYLTRLDSESSDRLKASIVRLTALQAVPVTEPVPETVAV